MDSRMNEDDVLQWITIFYNNGIIRDCTMVKKEARALFYKLCRNESQTFSQFLAALGIFKYTTTNKPPIIHFKREQLEKVLKSKKPVSNIQTVKNGYQQKPRYVCKVCSSYFCSQADLLSHHIRDKGHHFRQLYFNNSESLKKSSSEILIEISKGSGWKQEILSLNTNKRESSYIYITNISQHLYILNDITQISRCINNISLMKKNLPIHLKPKSKVQLEIYSQIPEAITALFVHVFSFTNATKNTRWDLVKEIMLQVTAEIYNDLLPTSKYVRPKPVRNDIKTGVCVRVENATPNYGYVVSLGAYPIPGMLKKLLAAGLEPFEGITDSEYNYLLNIEKLLQEHQPGQYLSRKNYYHLLDLLIHMEEFQLSIDIRNYDTETRDLVKVRGYSNRYQLKVPDLAERRPSLLPKDSVYVKAAGSKTFQGVVQSTHEDSVILEFNRQFTKDVYTSGINLSVTYGYNRSIMKCEHRSVDLLSQHRVLAPFFPSRINATGVKQQKLRWFNKKIESNPEQQQAILHILSRSSYPSPYLIFGPPGTGKTMTIVEAISQVWITYPKAKILVCAPSNSVANEIALRLTPYVPQSQLFRYMSVSFEMFNIPEEVVPFSNYDHGEFYTPTLTELCGYRIVISTLSNAARLVSVGIPARHFSYVFIDESGHATETETLIPIAGLLTCEESAGTVLGQIVLAGDPQQLGPIIHSSIAKKYGYDTSMLERLMTTIDLYKKDEHGKYNPMALTKLINNYRSHPFILHLPNKMFYDNELIPNGNELVYMASHWEKLPNKNIPIIFHSVIGSDQREANSPSYFNIQEIEVAIKYLTDLINARLKGRKVTQKDIGIITPYRKQVQKIRQACSKKNWTDLTIGSVEQFQGQERLIIIISTVRSQPKLLKFDNRFHLGFLNNPKRFNVAITRAKALVIVIGNPNLLQYETYWRIFIKYCIDNKCLTGAPFKFARAPVDALALDMAKMRIDGEPDDVADFSRGYM